jgi:Icc-related predicted phosphoesterase
MKILAVSDQIIDRLYSSSITATYPGVNMIIGCGDLPYAYLEFLLSVFSVPTFYVPGNHDPAYRIAEGFYAEGGVNLDGEVVYHKGLLMAGLGGSVLYPPGGPNQYTQRAMFLKVYRLLTKILIAQRRHKRPLDIFVTHSPPAGIHDDDDQTHRGMQAFNYLLEKVKPRYMLHGHTIFYSQNLKSHISTIGQTQVMNVYPYRVFDVD